MLNPGIGIKHICLAAVPAHACVHIQSRQLSERPFVSAIEHDLPIHDTPVIPGTRRLG